MMIWEDSDTHDVITGSRATMARIALNDISIRAKQLVNEMRRVEYGSPAFKVLDQQFNELLEEIDTLEKKYFPDASYVAERSSIPLPTKWEVLWMLLGGTVMCLAIVYLVHLLTTQR